MTIEKAIEILSESAYHGSTTFNEDYKTAQKLLIEAGKRIEQERALHTYPAYKLLPGETEID